MTLLPQNVASSFDVAARFASSPFLHRFAQEARESRGSEKTGRGDGIIREARREVCQLPREPEGAADLQRRTAHISALLPPSVFAELCRNQTNPDLESDVLKAN